MLFYLKYINHDVEKLQELLVYFFNKVEELNSITFDRKTLLPDWYNDYCNQPRNQGMRDLERSLIEFIGFDNTVKKQVIKAFEEANKMDLLFSDRTVAIPTALDFNKEYQTFLNELFPTLYTTQLSKRLIDSAPFPKIINNDISDHFKKLKEENQNDDNYGNFTVCPFCGIEPYKLPDSEGRPDYDHLLPKGNSLFVFSAVNMKNLFPIGSHCNKLKEAKNLLYEDNNRTIRTIAFYPYDDKPHPFELIDFTLSCKRQPIFRKNGIWEVNILPKNSTDNILQEKIDTWIRVFNIKARYEEHIQSKDFTLIENLFLGQKDIEKLKKNIKDDIDRHFRLSFSFIAINFGLIPLRIFYQWILDNSVFLEGFVNANNAPNAMYNQDDLV